MAKVIPQTEWEWFGVSGHYICSQWCRFHLCTKVGNYLVSTVGAYVHPRHGMGNEQLESAWIKKNWPGEDIGRGRKYETMVFLAGSPCVEEGCDCGMPTIGGTELAMQGYTVAKDATAGHLAMCKKYATVK